MTAAFWFALTFLCILIEAFFAMGEMAIISFSRLRLQYYLSRGNFRARLIHKMIKNPTALFGTALLGVNVALQVGSECSRQFYAAADLNPDLAPITQFFLVVIIAELAPLFAARRYAETIALAEAPLIYGVSVLLYPVIWIFGFVVKGVNKFFKAEEIHHAALLSREELQKALEEQDEPLEENAEFNVIVKNIFELKAKIALDVMVPMNLLRMLASDATVENVRKLMLKEAHTTIPLYHRYRHNVIAIVTPKSLLKAQGLKKAKDYCKSPWYIAGSSPLIDILNQFRTNNQSAAIVLGESGHAVGLLTLNDLLKKIFDEKLPEVLEGEDRFVERSVSGHLTLSEFNDQFKVSISDTSAKTLEELLIKKLGHHPEPGESLKMGLLEIIVQESTLMGIKTVLVRTRI